MPCFFYYCVSIDDKINLSSIRYIMRRIKVFLLLICCAFCFQCSVNKKVGGGNEISITKQPKNSTELAEEPKRSRLLLTFLDKETSTSVRSDVQLLVNNIQFLPDSNKKINLNLFSGQYTFQAIGIGCDKRIFKLFVDEKYNYILSIKLSPNRNTFN